MGASFAPRWPLIVGVALGAMVIAGSAMAQTSPPVQQEDTPAAATPTGALPTTDATPQGEESNGRDIVVTGSRIKQDPNNSALPLQIITTQEIQRNGISNPEQLLSFLSSNGTGADNLASNADVVTGAQRGTNGLSAANLRGQGSAATLILLNGRRVAAHGLSGSAVDVNQIPFAAIDRVEVLKDGASAIYGTDAIGGVINFITKKDFKGLSLQAFDDITERGGGNIYRLSATAGWGDIKENGFNVMGAVSKEWRNVLNGYQRDFVNGDQPDRGLSIDTRGTPIATAFPLNPGTYAFANGTLLGGTTATNRTYLPGLVFRDNPTQRADGGINILDLPGGAGCTTMDGGLAYDEALWNTPSARYACAWDTGRAAVIQQPIQTLTYYGRAVGMVGPHQFAIEVTGSKADSAKRFSNAQVSANTTNLQVAYPLNDVTRDTYNRVYNALLTQFPAISTNYGLPIAYRWRCIACGTREYATTAKTFRIASSVEGPIAGPWEYSAGTYSARSEVASTLGNGYFYRGTTATGNQLDPKAPIAPGATQPGLVGLLNAGILNPFSTAQSDAAIAGLQAISAFGETLYGGRYTVRQFDASVTGPLFTLPGGEVRIAAGIDHRREGYGFNGSAAAAADQPVIFLAAFDNVNALRTKSRTVKAAYAELLVPVFKWLELSAAGRIDDYTGFGSTTNPKFSVKVRPIDPIMFRGSYSTGFRVPTFNQIFNGITESPYQGRDLVDPVRCPSLQVSATDPNCAIIQPNVNTGGNPDLGPETSKQFSAGVVFQPSRHFSISADWWKINVDNTIIILALRDLINSASLFPERFIRDPATNNIITIDQTYVNAGARRTQGIDVTANGSIDGLGGTFAGGIDGTYLLKRREKLVPNAPYSPSLIGVFTFTGDLSLRWKHVAYVTYGNDDFSLALTQIFRNGYSNQALPGIANGTVTRPDYNPRVSSYIIYNASVSYLGVPGFRLTAGIRNLFDKDPPFAVTYDSNSGAGGSWEPRVADPRGRSFTMSVEARF